jgi:hypothetical protein
MSLYEIAIATAGQAKALGLPTKANLALVQTQTLQYTTLTPKT